MTSKEKADELFIKYDLEFDGLGTEQIKKMAIICVEEIIKANPTYIDEDEDEDEMYHANTYYWLQVKFELQKCNANDFTMPKYLAFSPAGSSVLRHRGNGIYYRDAGAWEVRVIRKRDRFFANCPGPLLAHLHEKELFSVCRDIWANDNEGYL